MADLGTRRVSDREFCADPLLITGAEGAARIVFERVQFRRQSYLLWLHGGEAPRETGGALLTLVDVA